MTITTSVLMCHAPIVVAGIADRDDAAKCQRTTAAMRAAAKHLVETTPDALVIVSPHSPRHATAFLVASDEVVEGTFSRFGAPQIGARLPFADGLAAEIVAAATELGVEVQAARMGSLDHGALVPLSFVVDAGFVGPTVRIAFPYGPTHAACEAMGRAIALAAERRDVRTAFIASGDMSHRLLPGAPSGYDPQAKHFDAAVVRAVEAGDLRAASRVDPTLRELAAEDVIDSLDVAIGVTSGHAKPHQLLSYEGPFGVGYLVAVLE